MRGGRASSSKLSILKMKNLNAGTGRDRTKPYTLFVRQTQCSLLSSGCLPLYSSTRNTEYGFSRVRAFSLFRGNGRHGLGSAVAVGSLSETKHEFVELSILRARSRLSVGKLYYLFYTATVIFIPKFYSFTGKIQEFLSEFVHPHH